MNTFQCLFFFRDGKVRVYRFKGNELTELKKDGLLDIPFREDSEAAWTALWDWWERATGRTEDDDVDFFFVSDTERMFKHDFPVHKPTAWGRRKLELFFRQHCKDPVIDLQWKKKNRIASLRIKDFPTPKLPPDNGKTAVFHVYPPLDINVSVNPPDPQGGAGPLYEGFHNYVEKNRKKIREKTKRK